MKRDPLLKLLSAICHDRGGRDRLRDSATLVAWATEHGVAAADRETLAQHGGRIGVYRALVRTNFLNVVDRALPLTRRLMNAQADDAFDDAFVDFLDQRGARSPILRDIPGELLAFALPRWRALPRETMPEWAPSLAELELARYDAEAAVDMGTPGTELASVLSLESHLKIAASSRLVSSAFAVHRLPLQAEATAKPARTTTWLAITRDAAGEVQTVTIDAVGFLVAQQLAAGESLGGAMQAAAEARGIVLTPQLLEKTARALSLLADSGFFAA